MTKVLEIQLWHQGETCFWLDNEKEWWMNSHPMNIQSWFPLGLTGLISLLSCPVQFSCSVLSGSLWPHGLQHTRLSCTSPAPRACSNSCPSSQWCHSTISFSVEHFSCLQSFPASGSFLMNQFFATGGRGTGTSASASFNSFEWYSFQWIFRTDFL